MEPWLTAIAAIVLALVIGYANFQNAKPFRIESSTSRVPATPLNTLQARLRLHGDHGAVRGPGRPYTTHR